jgi:hypothetical protein
MFFLSSTLGVSRDIFDFIAVSGQMNVYMCNKEVLVTWALFSNSHHLRANYSSSSRSV